MTDQITNIGTRMLGSSFIILEELQKQTQLLTEIRDAIMKRQNEDEKLTPEHDVHNLRFPRGSKSLSVLKKRNINTLKELTRRTAKELRYEEQMSWTCIGQIRRALDKLGMRLKDDGPSQS